MIPVRDRLIFALDVPTAAEASATYGSPAQPLLAAWIVTWQSFKLLAEAL